MTVCAQARRYEPDSPLGQAGWQADFWSFGDLTTALAALRQVTLGFSLADLGRFMVNAAAYSFQPASVRTALVRTLQDAWPG